MFIPLSDSFVFVLEQPVDEGGLADIGRPHDVDLVAVVLGHGHHAAQQLLHAEAGLTAHQVHVASPQHALFLRFLLLLLGLLLQRLALPHELLLPLLLRFVGLQFLQSLQALSGAVQAADRPDLTVDPGGEALGRGVSGQQVDLVGSDHDRVRACDLLQIGQHGALQVEQVDQTQHHGFRAADGAQQALEALRSQQLVLGPARTERLLHLQGSNISPSVRDQSRRGPVRRPADGSSAGRCTRWTAPPAPAAAV